MLAQMNVAKHLGLAAFAKGLLALEGELTPILVQMVKSAHTNGLLDNDCESSKFQRQ